MRNKIKIIFFGTPAIGAKCLEALHADGDFEILCVVTQEDKPVGRKKIITPSEVKVAALKLGLNVYQPSALNDSDDLYVKLSALSPDYNVVVAYGQIMSQKWLDLPTRYSVNLHVSLLPKYRGASPMQEALLRGDAVTGVTVQKMASKMDTGDILSAESFEIAPNDTFFEVYARGGDIGLRLLVETLKADFDGKIIPLTQDESMASHCTKITKEDGFVDFEKMTAREIYNKYRAYKMWPGIWTMYKGKRMKLTEIRPIVEDGLVDIQNTGQFFARCKEGVLEVTRAQAEGKKEMTVEEMLRGF